MILAAMDLTRKTQIHPPISTHTINTYHRAPEPQPHLSEHLLPLAQNICVKGAARC